MKVNCNNSKILFHLKKVIIIQKDKIMHFTAGALIYLTIIILDLLNIYTFASPLLMVLLAGIAKEIHDYFFDSHKACIMDILATVAGGLLVYLVLIIF